MKINRDKNFPKQIKQKNRTEQLYKVNNQETYCLFIYNNTVLRLYSKHEQKQPLINQYTLKVEN